MPVRTMLTCLTCLTCLSLAAAENADEATGADADSPAATLRAEIDPGADAPLAIDGEGLWWQGGDGRFQLSALEDGQVLVETPIGTIAAERQLVADGGAKAAEAFAARIAAAAEAGLASTPEERLRFGDSILTGLRLRGGGHLVVDGGVLTQVDDPAAVREAAVDELKQAVAAVMAGFDRTDLERPAQKSVEEVLRKLDQVETGHEDGDEITPSYARRIVRHGWLRSALPGLPDEIARLEQAVTATAGYEAKLSYRGDGLVLDHLTDAFDHGGWFMRSPTVTRLALRPRLPFYHWTAQETLRGAMLVVEYPAGTSFDDAAAIAVEPSAVRLYHQERPLAWWTAEDGFGADEAAWRQVVPAGGFNLDPNIVRDYCPPHLVLMDFDGDVDRVITAHGSLAAPRDGSESSGEAFLAAAAEVLPDAPHLDLIGQYLFKYTYDSPDSRHPGLLGTKTISGDIHQTALQTLATTAGGVCRGDCDDLSELIQDILERQGETAHVISLPSHAAVAWADERDDGWHVFVMQTGPTLEFVDQRLQDALAQTYKRFDAGETFDPNGLGLLLRFSGENTRSAWRLSYRIFSEPDYAQTMIDVQRDWHYQTYLEGIRKMEEMIAEGDEDTANYRELAGLFSFTGQYAKAAEYLQIAIDRTEEADSKIYETAELIHHLLEAGDVEQAQAKLDELLGMQIPPRREQMGTAAVNLGLQLCGYLLDGEQPELALQVLDELVTEEVTEMSGFVTNWLSTRFDQRTWDNHPQLRQIKRILQWHAGTVFTILDEVGTDALMADPALREQLALATRWLDSVAFYDTEDEAQVLGRYAIAGAYYAGVLGRETLLRRIEEAGDPDLELEVDHRDRIGGLAQVGLDLPWIRISPAYWQGALTKLVTGDEPIDRELVARLAERLEHAIAVTEARDVQSLFLENDIHAARLLVALLSEDEPALRQLLQRVVEKDDKRLRDSAAMWIGNSAKHLGPEWWDRVLTAWREVVDYKPKYYWIAWRAALSDAPERALEAAALAAERFADDPAFVQEERFMRKLLTAPEPAEAEATAP